MLDTEAVHEFDQLKSWYGSYLNTSGVPIPREQFHAWFPTRARRAPLLSAGVIGALLRERRHDAILVARPDLIFKPVMPCVLRRANLSKILFPFRVEHGRGFKAEIGAAKVSLPFVADVFCWIPARFYESMLQTVPDGLVAISKLCTGGFVMLFLQNCLLTIFLYVSVPLSLLCVFLEGKTYIAENATLLIDHMAHDHAVYQDLWSILNDAEQSVDVFINEWYARSALVFCSDCAMSCVCMCARCVLRFFIYSRHKFLARHTPSRYDANTIKNRNPLYRMAGREEAAPETAANPLTR